MKRATLLLIAAMLLAGSALSASVKTAQEPRHPPAAVAPQGESPAAQEGGAATPASAPAAREGERQPEGGQPAHDTLAKRAEAVEHEGGEAEAAESPWAIVARLFNFALLAGALIYLLRSPFGAFLESRKVQIRRELTDAAALRETAAGQLTAIDEKLRQLPDELEALKRRGTAEIAAEEERIRQAADVERARLLENARREIDRRGQLAERRLLQRAGDLAVDLATERVKRTITDADQARLLDRYLEQVRPETIGS